MEQQGKQGEGGGLMLQTSPVRRPAGSWQSWRAHMHLQVHEVMIQSCSSGNVNPNPAVPVCRMIQSLHELSLPLLSQDSSLSLVFLGVEKQNKQTKTKKERKNKRNHWRILWLKCTRETNNSKGLLQSVELLAQAQ